MFLFFKEKSHRFIKPSKSLHLRFAAVFSLHILHEKKLTFSIKHTFTIAAAGAPAENETKPGQKNCFLMTNKLKDYLLHRTQKPTWIIWLLMSCIVSTQLKRKTQKVVGGELGRPDVILIITLSYDWKAPQEK